MLHTQSVLVRLFESQQAIRVQLLVLFVHLAHAETTFVQLHAHLTILPPSSAWRAVSPLNRVTQQVVFVVRHVHHNTARGTPRRPLDATSHSAQAVVLVQLAVKHARLSNGVTDVPTHVPHHAFVSC